MGDERGGDLTHVAMTRVSEHVTRRSGVCDGGVERL